MSNDEAPSWMSEAPAPAAAAPPAHAGYAQNPSKPAADVPAEEDKLPAWAREGNGSGGGGGGDGGSSSGGGGGFDFNKPRATQQQWESRHAVASSSSSSSRGGSNVPSDSSHLPAWMREGSNAPAGARGGRGGTAQRQSFPALEGLDDGDDEDFFSGDASASLLGGEDGGGNARKKGCCERCRSWCGQALTSSLLLLTMIVSWALMVLAFVSSCPLARSQRSYREAALFFSGFFAFAALWDFRQKKCKRFKWRVVWIALAVVMGVAFVALLSIDSAAVVNRRASCPEDEVPVDVIPVGDSVLVVAWVLIELVLCKSKKNK